MMLWFKRKRSMTEEFERGVMSTFKQRAEDLEDVARYTRNEALEEAVSKCLELAHEEDECPDEFDDHIKRALIEAASSIRALITTAAT